MNLNSRELLFFVMLDNNVSLLLQEADFYMYSLYSKNKPKSDDIMAECGSLYFAVSLCIGDFCRFFVEC